MTTLTAPARRPRSFRRWYSDKGYWLALMAPVLIFLLAAQFYPLLETIRIGFTNETATAPGETEWVGFDNYSQLLREDPRFWQIFRNSIFWVLGSVVLQLVLGTLAALVLNLSLRLRALWRGLLMVPWVTPVVVVAIIWRWLFQGGESGLINHYLGRVGIIDDPIVFLASDVWVWPVLLLASTWKGLPFAALLILAALQSLPKEVQESAAMDGANAIQRFWHVTLPHLQPTLFVTGMTSLVTTWFKFEIIWALTNGGPGFATSILPTYVYTFAFQRFQFGTAGSVATIAMVIVLVLAAIVALLFGERRQKGASR
ncbi:carbohydrate ABC transporter permease [Pseudactinotalea sp.]|uniref:carbohydrate ABC transporter permease n=1 Tax=Pseudactinotalea sp. TaxID=1926260 RepID=UPI003B3B717E